MLLTVSEVADQLGLAPSTVWAMIRRGELPTVRLSARATRIKEEDVERLIGSRYDGQDEDDDFEDEDEDLDDDEFEEED